MVRSIAGHGSRSTRKPEVSLGTDCPVSSTTSTLMPGIGTCAEPGLAVVTPGSWEIMMAPVSVCHQVSTIGQRSPPMTRRYHIHASGLIGSPTVPSRRRLDKSCLAGSSGPHFMNVRIAVGAVYRMVTPYFSTISQKRSLPG